MPESGRKGTSGGITTGTTGIIINGIIAKTAGIGVGGLKGMKLIVPFTNFTERSRENTGSFVTSIRIVTLAANSHALHYAIIPGMGTHFTTIPGIAFGSVERNIDI